MLSTARSQDDRGCDLFLGLWPAGTQRKCPWGRCGPQAHMRPEGSALGVDVFTAGRRKEGANQIGSATV